MGDGPRFTMYTTSWCGFCARLSRQLESDGLLPGLGYDVVDIERQPDAAAIVMQANNGNQTVPTLVYPDGSTQTNPSLAQVKDKLATL